MSRARRPRILALALLALLDLGVFLVAQYRFFVDPWSDAPSRTDGIAVLGPGFQEHRYDTAVAVARRFPGMTILLSTPSHEKCPPPPPGAAAIVCFRPDPLTTRGEARFAAAYARNHHWRSLSVVTTKDQLLRAELRFTRCWSGTLRMIEASSPYDWNRVWYQNGAMVKAEVWQRGC